jgi:type I restriction enzyme S subunit
MKHWPIRTLSEVCIRVTDGSHRTPPFTDSGFPFVTVAHVNEEGVIDLAACRRISRSDFEELKRNDCRPLPGDVLFSKDGTVGKVALIEFATDFVVLSSLAILRPKREVVSQKFLAYALRSESVLSQAVQKKSGSAIRRIVLRDLCRVSLPVPPLAEQERLVKLLDEADELRKMRAEADRRTANLIPALFNEMFGAHAHGVDQWPTMSVAELASARDGSIRTGPFGSDLRHSEFVEKGIPVLGIDNVSANEFRWTKARCITEEKFKEMKRFITRPRDVLVTIMGTVGRCCVALDDLPICISTKHLCAVTLDQEKANPWFIVSFLGSKPSSSDEERLEPFFGHRLTP